MVFRAITGTGTGGDLYTDAAAQYGALDDVILVLSGNNSDIITGEGNDTVYTVRALAGASNTAFLGFGDDLFYGGPGDDLVIDGSGNDTAILGAGTDSARACFGNDYVDAGDGVDNISFNTESDDDGGSPFGNSDGVVFDLAKTTAQSLGKFGSDIYLNFENISGSNGVDVFFGTAGANSINGFGGNDVIDGRAGNDRLFAGNGADTLTGGLGNDLLHISETTAARDTVRYLAITDSGLSIATADEIVNFDKGGAALDDKIDLSALDAALTIAGNQGFAFRGYVAAFSSQYGEVRLLQSGADTYVYIDTDADAAIEMQFKVLGVSGLNALDFIL